MSASAASNNMAIKLLIQAAHIRADEAAKASCEANAAIIPKSVSDTDHIASRVLDNSSLYEPKTTAIPLQVSASQVGKLWLLLNNRYGDLQSWTRTVYQSAARSCLVIVSSSVLAPASFHAPTGRVLRDEAANEAALNYALLRRRVHVAHPLHPVSNNADPVMPLLLSSINFRIVLHCKSELE